LFASAARALRKGYVDWACDAGITPQVDLLDQAIAHAFDFALGVAGAIDPHLLEAVESAVPDEPSDESLFTVAQDCWIVADTALRVGLGMYDAGSGCWYLVESLFQETSERLFGTPDPGSETQETDEAVALNDPALALALTDLFHAIKSLAVGEPNDVALARLQSLLSVLLP